MPNGPPTTRGQPSGSSSDESPGATGQRPAMNKRKQRVFILSSAVFVLLVGALVLMMNVQQQSQTQFEDRDDLVEPRRPEKSDTLLQDAKHLIRDGKWMDAKAKLLELQEVEPGHAQLPDYLARVEKEIPNQSAIDAAKVALDKNQLAQASTALSKVAKDTLLFNQVVALQRALRDQADKRVLEAQGLLEQKQLEQARAITDDVLAALPDHRDARFIHEQVTHAITVRDAPTQEGTQPWDQAVDRFRDGDLQGAMALAKACSAKSPQCKALMAQMGDFGNLYKRLEDLDVEGLVRLLDLDKKITSGRGSNLAAKAGTRAANIFYKTALAAKAAGQWGRATESAQRALQVDKNHAGALNIVTEMRYKAKDLYLQLYALKDADPEAAVSMLEEVMIMTPADDEIHQKAKIWIEKLSQR